MGNANVVLVESWVLSLHQKRPRTVDLYVQEVSLALGEPEFLAPAPDDLACMLPVRRHRASMARNS